MAKTVAPEVAPEVEATVGIENLYLPDPEENLSGYKHKVFSWLVSGNAVEQIRQVESRVVELVNAGEAEQQEILKNLNALNLEIDQREVDLLATLESMDLDSNIDLSAMVKAGVAAYTNQRAELESELASFTQRCWQKAVEEILPDHIGFSFVGGSGSGSGIDKSLTHPVKYLSQTRVYLFPEDTPDRIAIYNDSAEFLYLFSEESTTKAKLTSPTAFQKFHTNLHNAPPEGYKANGLGKYEARDQHIRSHGLWQTACGGDSGYGDKGGIHQVKVSEFLASKEEESPKK